MPTYNYECVKCGNVQEEFHSISTEPKIKCQLCESECEKKFSPTTNFVLKGDGFETYNSKIKRSMTQKNNKMKGKMVERTTSGQGVENIGDLKKKNNSI